MKILCKCYEKYYLNKRGPNGPMGPGPRPRAAAGAALPLGVLFTPPTLQYPSRDAPPPRPRARALGPWAHGLL